MIYGEMLRRLAEFHALAPGSGRTLREWDTDTADALNNHWEMLKRSFWDTEAPNIATTVGAFEAEVWNRVAAVIHSLPEPERTSRLDALTPERRRYVESAWRNRARRMGVPV